MEAIRVKPDNHMALAILSTIFCCLPFGIVAIVKASKVDSLFMMGDDMGAQQAANDAKKYAMIGAILAVVGWVIYLIFCVVYGVALAEMFY